MSFATSDLELAEEEAGAQVELVSGEIAARSPWELFFKRFREDKFALVSIGFLILLILVAIFAPLVVKLFGAPGPVRGGSRTRSTSSASRPDRARPTCSGSIRSAATCSAG